MPSSNSFAARQLGYAASGMTYWLTWLDAEPASDLSTISESPYVTRVEITPDMWADPITDSRWVHLADNLTLPAPSGTFDPWGWCLMDAATAGTPQFAGQKVGGDESIFVAGAGVIVPAESVNLTYPSSLVGLNPTPGVPGPGPGGDPTPPGGGPPPPPPPVGPPPGDYGGRFPADPGAGRIWYGLSSASGSPADREDHFGALIGMFRTYGTPNESVSSLISRASTQLAAGRLPWLSAKVPGSNWANVANGSQDTAWLDPLLDGLMALSGPVWLCLHHEPYDNLGDTPGSTKAAYVAMHRRVKSKVAGANIAVVPILQSAPFTPSTTGGHPKDTFDDWFANDACDVIGLDSYNHAYWEPPGGSDLQYNKWREPSLMFGESWSLVQQFERPVAYGEYGVRTDYTNPGRSRTWMEDAYEWLFAHDVVGMSYFDSDRNVNDSQPDQPAPPWDLNHGGTVRDQIQETIPNGYPHGPERLDAFAGLMADARTLYLP